MQVFAGGLRAAGLNPGDKLLLRLGHSPTFPVAFLAATWSGILPIPTSEALTRRELDAIVAAIEPTAILAEADIRLPQHAARILFVDTLPKTVDLIEVQRGDPNRVGYFMTTSGTSGQPRVVAHAHRAIWGRRPMHAGWTDMKASDRVLHAGALNWSYTLGTGLFDPWSVGATALVLAKGMDHAAIPLMAKRHDASIVAAVPGIYRKLLKGPLPSFPKLRHALSAGEKLPESVRSAWLEATGTDIHEAFGQTECSTFISGSPFRPAPSEKLGYAQPGRAVAIANAGRPVLRGETGEIAIHRDDPGLALSAVEDDGDWIGTGDLGVMQEDGAISYLGRKDDVLTAGGFRVAPQEIEQIFEVHPGISAAAAVDHEITPDTRVIALFYTGPGTLEVDDLKRHASEHLAAHKIPRVFVHRQSLPHGTNGKLLRAALRAEKDTAS